MSDLMSKINGTRTAFFLTVLISLGLAYQIGSKPQIDTDLADVSPSLANLAETQLAAETIQSFAQKRIIFLLEGEDENAVFDAEQDLRQGLEALDGLRLIVSNEQLLSGLLEGLSPSRFMFQTEAQSTLLTQLDANQLSDRAIRKLHSGLSQAAVFNFSQDPLFWHNDTFSDIISQLRLVTADDSGDRFIALVSADIVSGALNVDKQEQLIVSFNELQQQLSSNHKVTIERSGVFFFAADAAQNAKQDITTISVGSGLGVVVILLIAFASLRALILPLLSVAVGVAFAFIITHSVFGNVHVLTIVFGASLIGVVIDYSLHYYYHQIGASPNSTQDSLVRALRLSLFTSVIGYAALSLSSLEALQKVAVFSCCGLVMAWLCVMSFGQYFAPKSEANHTKLFPALSSWLALGLGKISKSIALLLSASVILTAIALLSTQSLFNDDPRVFFTPSDELLASEARVAQSANDFEPGRYLVIAANDLENLYLLHRQLIEAIQTKGGDVSAISSLLSWVPSISQQQEIYQSQQKLYAAEGAAQTLIEKLPSGSEGVQLAQKEYIAAENRFVSVLDVQRLFDGAIPPMVFQSSTNNSIVGLVLVRKGADLESLSTVAETLSGVNFVNTVADTSEALSQQRSSASSMLLLAYLLVALLMLIRYRRLSCLWLLLIPASATAGVVGLCYLLSISLNLFHVMALFLVLGFGMDYSIFTKELGHKPSLTLPAILVSALTSMLSFGLLSLSAIPIIASFGLTLLIGNTLNLVGAFIATQAIHDGSANISNTQYI